MTKQTNKWKKQMDAQETIKWTANGWSTKEKENIKLNLKLNKWMDKLNEKADRTDQSKE